MLHVLVSVALLLLALAAGVGLHAFAARACKAVIASMRPLATGEHQSFGYERFVYHTAEPAVQKVVLIALGGGLAGWLAWLSGWELLWWLAVAVLAAAVVFDLLNWERVASSASWLWFQRGLRGTVHQVALDNIRDLVVDEEEAPGLTLRNLVPGARNTVCRLRLRLADKRVVALPRTDAARGLADVEAVANHLRLRKQQATERGALADSAEAATQAVREVGESPSSVDRALAAELKRLRRGALAPDVPPAVRSQRRS